MSSYSKYTTPETIKFYDHDHIICIKNLYGIKKIDNDEDDDVFD